MSHSVFCEICGKENKNVRAPERLIAWHHNELRKPVTCFAHNRVSLYAKHLRRYDPLTGKLKEVA